MLLTLVSVASLCSAAVRPVALPAAAPLLAAPLSASSLATAPLPLGPTTSAKILPIAPPAFLDGWQAADLSSALDGTNIRLELRGARDCGEALLYVGGLGMADSLRPLADAQLGGAQAYLLLRGHQPSGWTRGANVTDADARDLARAVLTAAEQFPRAKLTLVLHSYAGLAFQRMVALADDAEVASALLALRGGRVDFVTTTSRRAGAWLSWGPEHALAAPALDATIKWIDEMDGYSDSLRSLSGWNPLLSGWTVAWEGARQHAISAITGPLVSGMRGHLDDGWKSGRFGVRAELAARSTQSARDPDWNEAIFRRSHAVSQLDFTPEDAATLRALGVHVRAVVARNDQLLAWHVSQLLLTALGIKSPLLAPPAGTVLRDASGLFEAVIVDGDHYMPVKDPEGLAAALSR
jgi:hypothetical protein